MTNDTHKALPTLTDALPELPQEHPNYPERGEPIWTAPAMRAYGQRCYDIGRAATTREAAAWQRRAWFEADPEANEEAGWGEWTECSKDAFNYSLHSKVRRFEVRALGVITGATPPSASAIVESGAAHPQSVVEQETTVSEPSGTYACPICGSDKPHVHPSVGRIAHHPETIATIAVSRNFLSGDTELRLSSMHGAADQLYEGVYELVARLPIGAKPYAHPAPDSSQSAIVEGAQPTNVEDAARGNANAIRHVAYAEGYSAGKSDALEEAAKVCEAVQSHRLDVSEWKMAEAAGDCAKFIRAEFIRSLASPPAASEQSDLTKETK